MSSHSQNELKCPGTWYAYKWGEDNSKIAIRDHQDKLGILTGMDSRADEIVAKLNLAEWNLKLMNFVYEKDINFDLYWGHNCQFLINCNDLFVPASDYENIDPEDWVLFTSTYNELEKLQKHLLSSGHPIKKSLVTTKFYTVFVARKRNLQPMKRFMTTMEEGPVKDLLLKLRENPY